MANETSASFSDVRTLDRDEFKNFIKTCDSKNLPSIITIDNFIIGDEQSEDDYYYINKDQFVGYLDWLTDEWWINLQYLFELMNNGTRFGYDYVMIDSNSDPKDYPEQMCFVRITMRGKDGEEKHIDVLNNIVISNLIDMYYVGDFAPDFESIFSVKFEDLLQALNYEREEQ